MSEQDQGLPDVSDPTEQPPPLTAMDRATMRAMAYWNIDRTYARDMVEHTFIGRQMLANELLLDLGRALRAALPPWLLKRFLQGP